MSKMIDLTKVMKELEKKSKKQIEVYEEHYRQFKKFRDYGTGAIKGIDKIRNKRWVLLDDVRRLLEP
jgi:predicted  nucleic acid-binding Zn-ribbon protein